MSIQVKIFRAGYGDSFLITINEKHQNINILVDCGLKSTYKDYIREELKSVKCIDLLILTHIDNDHINGAISLFQDTDILNDIEIKNIWFNDLYSLLKKKNFNIEMDYKDSNIKSEEFKKENFDEEVGFNSAVELRSYMALNKYTKILNSNCGLIECSKDLYEVLHPINNEIKFVLLSPHATRNEMLLEKWSQHSNIDTDIINDEIIAEFYEKFGKHESDVDDFDEECSFMTYDIEKMANEDIIESNVVNDSSIAFFIEIKDKKLLFLGDSNPLDVHKSLCKYIKDEEIEELNFELVKVSHHGSKNNTIKDFFEKNSSKKYIISSNGRRFNHPDIECLSKIIVNQKQFKTVVFNYYRDDIYGFWNNQELKEKYKYEIKMPNKEDEYSSTVIEI